LQLIDVPEAGYFSTNKPLPQGEVLIRGPCIASGYYKRPDLNADPTIFDSEEKGGWFHTGDVGQWNADGTLSIIDRIKVRRRQVDPSFMADSLAWCRTW